MSAFAIDKLFAVSLQTLIAERLDKLERDTEDERAKLKRRPASARRSPAKKKMRANLGDLSAPSIETLEVVDLDVLRRLHAQRATLISPLKAAQTKFHNFYTNTMAANGRRRVLYQQKLNGERFGRFSPCNGLSFQNMDRAWRDTLVRDRAGNVMYEQIDMRKAHQSILLSIAEHYGWPTPHLRRYMSHTDEILDSLPCGRDEAKTIMLMLLYGGNAELAIGWTLPSFVQEYRAEMKGIATRLYAANAELVRKLQIESATPPLSEHKKMYVFMSRVLQDREAASMQAAVDYLVESGWVVGALLHDGFMVHKRAGAPLTDERLAAMSARVYERTQIRNIEFRLKDFGASVFQS